MKTAALKISRALMPALLLVCGAHASWNLSLDADGRAVGWREYDAGLHVAGVSLRKTFSDSRGDRFTAFMLAEAEDNFSDVMVHEFYGRYKGPMGVWNVTAGRFGVPYGLLVNFSTTRLLYQSLYGATLGMDVDNGLLVSGTKGMVDYAAAITQGYGLHHAVNFGGKGLGSGRIGFTLGDAGEFVFGVSGVYGRTVSGHSAMNALTVRALAAVDATLYQGRSVYRIEIDGGEIGERGFAAVFCAVDFGLFPALDISAAGSFTRHGTMNDDYLFFGLTFKPKWLTIRGGYRYAYYGTPHHEASLQLYRLFSWNF